MSANVPARRTTCMVCGGLNLTTGPVCGRTCARRGLKRIEREKAKARATSPAPMSGYCCPKCHALHATPEARKTCRESHREAQRAVAP